jgi:competence protein ComEA
MMKVIAAFILSLFMALPALAAVNLNSATQAELEAVKGIGPAKAQAIIAHREKNGPFKSVDDLANVKGFGKASVARLKDQFEVAAEPAKK